MNTEKERSYRKELSQPRKVPESPKEAKLTVSKAALASKPLCNAVLVLVLVTPQVGPLRPVYSSVNIQEKADQLDFCVVALLKA